MPVRQDSGHRRSDALVDALEALVALADSVAEDDETARRLTTLTTLCVRLLPISSAGILLSDQQGDLRVMSSSTEPARIVEQSQLDAGAGPVLDCFRASRAVVIDDLRADGRGWPRFAAQAEANGFRAVCAVPMRLRAQTIGVLSFLRADPGPLTEKDLTVGQSLADIATIGILHERALTERGVVIEQLQSALSSRVIIEQAKGVLAERRGVDVDASFALLRRHARNNNLRLTEVAHGVVAGTVDPGAPADAAAPSTPGPRAGAEFPPRQRHSGSESRTGSADPIS